MELSSRSQTNFRAFWRNVPWPLLVVVLAIASLGVWNLMSASRAAHLPFWRSQLNWLMIGAGLLIAVVAVDYRRLMPLAYPLYGIVVALLIAVLKVGKSVMGGQRWLDVGPVHIQPSELGKLAVAIVLARFFHDAVSDPKGFKLRQLWLPVLLLAVPVLLTIKEPDLGTGLMIAAVGASIILVAKVRWKSLLLITAVLVAGAVGVWNSGHLKDYQKRRVYVLLHPEEDLQGAGYHAFQSRIAVGSGMAQGKGWEQGTQAQLNFLPEQHTDFIFSVWGEEQGFVGGLALIGLYWLLALLALGVVAGARERFGAFLATGCAAMFFWQTVVNIGMVTGMLPVVGVTLPLMSYGGSSLLTSIIALGLLVNIAARKTMVRKAGL